MIVCPFTAAAAISSLNMLHNLVLGWDISQLPAQHRMPALMQRSAALWAEPLLFRQFMNNPLYGQVGKVLFSFALALSPFADDLLQIRLRRVR